ncbi:hypothetical protein [Foetidibacter luteolus]|uniref:hypothetical protein n=1 Tax=Foetidibacter luteolus TaxID=2608880 RepID=UPI00129A56A2|nr:hypothetical protein [Foetidibacter luteolus]
MARPQLERISQREYARRLQVSNEAVSKAVREGKIKKGWDAKAGKIIVEHANTEWGSVHMINNIEKFLPGSAETPNPPSQDLPANAEGDFTLTNKTTYAEARRASEILRARQISLDLKEREGELVNRDEVYKKLFSYGQEIRKTFTLIPDTCIDNIRAAKSRAEAHNVLTNAIYTALEKVTSENLDLNF